MSREERVAEIAKLLEQHCSSYCLDDGEDRGNCATRLVAYFGLSQSSAFALVTEHQSLGLDDEDDRLVFADAIAEYDHVPVELVDLDVLGTVSRHGADVKVQQLDEEAYVVLVDGGRHEIRVRLRQPLGASRGHWVVNWQAFGPTTADEAARYASALLVAATLADELNAKEE